MSAVKTISETQMPPIGGFGGSAHQYERSPDPFARKFIPEHLQKYFPDAPPRMGWLAIDWCGNVIGFVPDGAVFND